MSRAAGADGLLVKANQDPDLVTSNGIQTLDFDGLAALDSCEPPHRLCG